MFFELGLALSVKPVLDRESWNPPEVADVAGNQGEVMGERDRGYPKVGLIEPLASSLKSRTKRSVYVRSLLVEREDRDRVG